MLIDAKCKSCEKITEILIKRSELSEDGDVSPDHRCPQCGAELKKSAELNAGNFQLKGKGWARDNYG